VHVHGSTHGSHWWTTREPVLTAHGARIGALVLDNPDCVTALRQENPADHRLPGEHLSRSVDMHRSHWVQYCISAVDIGPY